MRWGAANFTRRRGRLSAMNTATGVGKGLPRQSERLGPGLSIKNLAKHYTFIKWRTLSAFGAAKQRKERMPGAQLAR